MRDHDNSLPVDYRTVVRVYDNSTGGADIVELNSPEVNSLPLAEQVVVGQTNSPRVSQVGSTSPGRSTTAEAMHRSNKLHASQPDLISSQSFGRIPRNSPGAIPTPNSPTYQRYTTRKDNLRETQDKPDGTYVISANDSFHTPPVQYNNQNRRKTNVSAHNGTTSDGESEASSAMKNSVTSLDSYQTKAMHAIRALDDVVANEPSELDFSSAPELPPSVPPVPPPPPPGE